MNKNNIIFEIWKVRRIEKEVVLTIAKKATAFTKK